MPFRTKAAVLFIAAAVSLCSGCLSKAPRISLPDFGGRHKTFSDWRDGDLIFQYSTRTGQSPVIAYATNSNLTHVGIIKTTAGGPVVVEASQTVRETPLKEFIALGRDGAYSVYRVKGLTPESAGRVLKAARAYYGKPYDLFFRMDNSALYCSELPYKAFHTAGISLGNPQKFSELNIHSALVRTVFNARWKKHPDCARVKSASACWDIVLNQEIISPARIAQAGNVVQVFP
ncbi:MAG: hypothetical protein LBR29_04145 [Methylobacteriaceae bacterium]|jgi:hypothetical protein|nr:hypothetical protein [Methylobacteriaceae bacterium]